MNSKCFFAIALVLGLTARLSGDELDNWTAESKSPYGSFVQIIYTNGVFVAISDFANTNTATNSIHGGISTSPDGTNWTHIAVHDVPSAIAFGNGVFVRTGSSSTNVGTSGFIFASANPAKLTNATSSLYQEDLFSVTYGTDQFTSGPNILTNDVFLAVGYSWGTNTGTIRTSVDGTNWSEQSPPAFGAVLSSVANYNRVFVALGSTNASSKTNGFIMTSNDATNWSPVPTNLTVLGGRLTNVYVVNGKFYVTQVNVTNGATAYYDSSGGRIWPLMNPPIPVMELPGTSNTEIYISLNGTSNLYTSPDNFSWTERNTGLTNLLTGIAYNGANFVLCTADGTLLKSGGSAPQLNGSVGYSNGMFQMTISNGIGPEYTVQASSNLTTWSNIYTFSNIETSSSFTDTNASNFSRRYYRVVGQ